ncbi:hypothetical protein [Phormidium sp. CCY1219]|jgi:plastocyanin domain-containing protein|uniref:hypothetical protein n=1 Tax=Phormidium sp. CCY1219 TaxID=2886104 RepID=UPI002D1ED5C8|nr:hypothetical protein [Phormidium sp. CCY1219]MEB3827547.1 hypothetical protein [Phormidium sp. CCY1219]
MKKQAKNSCIYSIIMAAFLLSAAPVSAKAQLPAEATTTESHFRAIEQPLALKIGVTAGGVALIGLELWWFLFSKNPAQKATAPGKPKEE